MKSKFALLLLLGTLLVTSAFAEKLPVVKPVPQEKNLYELFRNPDQRHRPYARWWWNGSRVTEAEILRELDLMHEAGIGGVEINTIRFPDQTDSLGYAALPWLSDEWVRMVNIAADGCRERGMVCDIIVGSGWPFGAEFLTPEEQIEQLWPVTIDVQGGHFSISRQEVLDRADSPIMNPREGQKELMYIRLMPKRVETFTPGVSYDRLVGDQTIAIDIPQGDYVLYFFVKRTGYMNVILGAPGASGPVVNHLDGRAVERYLNHFSDKMHFTSGNLRGKIRAAFCDSFELEGDNWTGNMPEEFRKRMGYDLEPYLPYVVRRVGGMGEPVREAYGCEFSEKVTDEVVNRVRNDFWHVQTELFRENFVDTYNDWCHRNGLLSRVQAYGRQLNPIEASMSIDLPECESWIHDGIGRVMNPNEYLSGRGYSQANKYVSSGAHLAGRTIVSCEEQTNVGNIFQTTLEEIKVTGDRSNLSGVNHSVLHGFNYTPPQEDFLGWIQFGTYFNEHNTWWPYLRRWTDYKSRISAVLQNSVFQADIAVMQPLEDLWSIHGQQRDPYPGVTYPVYANDLWEAIQQAGDGCDYVSDEVICQSSVGGGMLRFGQRAYRTLMLMEVESLSTEAAAKIEKFVAGGGRVVCIGKVPFRTFGFRDALRRDAQVKTVIDRIATRYADRFIRVDAPSGPILEWYLGVQKQYGLTPAVQISRPDRFLMLNCYKSGSRDICFAVNSSIERPQDVRLTFPREMARKQAWIWNAETGERQMLDLEEGVLELHLGRAESKLIVFENDRSGEWLSAPMARGDQTVEVTGPWQVRAEHQVDKTVREFEMTDLTDLHSLPFSWLQQFAGTLEYTCRVSVDDPEALQTLDAGLTYNGVTTALVNGQPVGLKWYGDRTFDVRGKLVKGENTLTIRVVTLLGNYVKARVKDTPTAQRWDWALRLNKQTGLCGPVLLY